MAPGMGSEGISARRNGINVSERAACVYAVVPCQRITTEPYLCDGIK